MTNKPMTYIGVIFAGGQAKRFGDVKQLVWLQGRPLLGRLIDDLGKFHHYKKRATSHIGVSLGSLEYRLELQDPQDVAGDFELKDFPTKLCGTPDFWDITGSEVGLARKRIEHFLIASEIADYLNSYPNVSTFYDLSKASCIKNIAACVNGDFDIFQSFLGLTNNEYDYHTEICKRRSDIDCIDDNIYVTQPINMVTSDRTFLWEYPAKCLPEEILKHSKDCGIVQPTLNSKKLYSDKGESVNLIGKTLKTAIHRQIANKIIVAINGDNFTDRGFSEAIYHANNAITRKGYDAYIGLYKTARPKQADAFTLDTSGNITSVTDKSNVSLVKEQAVIFAFNPSALQDIVVPRHDAEADWNYPSEESPKGLSYLCQELLAKGKKIFGRKYDRVVYDLNEPADYFLLRSNLRFQELELADLDYSFGADI